MNLGYEVLSHVAPRLKSGGVLQFRVRGGVLSIFRVGKEVFGRRRLSENLPILTAQASRP